MNKLKEEEEDTNDGVQRDVKYQMCGFQTSELFQSRISENVTKFSSNKKTF